MTWVRIDDRYSEHPKLSRIGPLGVALWLAGLAYCNRNLTDGFIPWGVSRSLVSWEFLDDPDDDGGERIVTVSATSGMRGFDVEAEYVVGLLCRAGVWDDAPGGYRVHDFKQYQPSKADVMDQRERQRDQRADAGRSRARQAERGDGGRFSSGPADAPADAPAGHQPRTRDTLSKDRERTKETTPSRSRPIERAREAGPVHLSDALKNAPWNRDRYGSAARNAQAEAGSDTDDRTPRPSAANGPIEQPLTGSIPGSARDVPGPNTEKK